MKNGKMVELTGEDGRQTVSACLVGIERHGVSAEQVEILLDELKQLCQSVDLDVDLVVPVKLREPHARFLLGTGKAEEIKDMCKESGVEVIVFDDELSPDQQRNWEKFTGLSVIDRSQVILDIFARRAKTVEAQLQVKMASLNYSLPRLVHARTYLSRQGGGMGSGYRGIGEQQIELDRRTISREISKVDKLLEEVQQHRDTQRKQRQRNAIATAAVVGYTNAGKSSLLNCLTDAGLLEEDKLFATLDPATKSLVLPDKQTLLLTDTVGFVSKLPHMLIDAFKATLEEAVIANFLVHIVDVTSLQRDDHIEVTTKVLEEIGAGDKDSLLVFNKIDLLTDRTDLDEIKQKYPDAHFISTKTCEGIDGLLLLLIKHIKKLLKMVKLRIPQSDAGVVSLLHKNSIIHSTEYEGNYILIEAGVSTALYNTLEKYVEKE